MKKVLYIILCAVILFQFVPQSEAYATRAITFKKEISTDNSTWYDDALPGPVTVGQTIYYKYTITNSSTAGESFSRTRVQDDYDQDGDLDQICQSNVDLAAGNTRECFISTLAVLGYINSTAIGAGDRNEYGGYSVSSTDGAEYVTGGMTTNPDLEAACGIDVILVLDESGSIYLGTDQTSDVRNAAHSFIDSLSGTGSQVAIVEFNTLARTPIPYTSVTPVTITSIFNPYIDATVPETSPRYRPLDYGDPDYFTNWDDALLKVENINTAGPVAPLVVFITDGDPTAHNTSHPVYDGNTTIDDVNFQSHMPMAIYHANAVKTQGSKIMAVGVGSSLSGGESQGRLKAISGPDVYSGPPDTLDIVTDDVMAITNFEDLETELRKLVLELCKNSVTVTKYITNNDESGPPWVVAPNWEITTNVQMDETGEENNFEWVTPPACHVEDALCPDTVSKSTDVNGTARWQWIPGSQNSPESWTSLVTITETMWPMSEFHHGTCTITRPNGTTYDVELHLGPPPAITLLVNEYATCEIYNARPTAVTLAGFTASPLNIDISILVEWQTILQTDTLGFNLYRSLYKNGTGMEFLGYIPVKIPEGGVAEYDYLDDEILPGKTYYYWLEVVAEDTNEPSQIIATTAATWWWNSYIPMIKR